MTPDLQDLRLISLELLHFSDGPPAFTVRIVHVVFIQGHRVGRLHPLQKCA